MNTEHDMKIRTVLFYIFTGFFVIISILTIASVFFSLGQPSESERATLFYTFIIEIGLAVAALFYLVFGIKKAESITKNCDDCLVKFGDKINVLSHRIDFASKVLNLQKYGSLKFQKDDFRNLWKHFAYQPEKTFYAISHMPAKTWTEEYARRVLIPTKSRMETDGIHALRIFVLENQNELDVLSSIVELHKQYKIPVSYVLIDKLVENKVCKKPLDYSYILIDDNTLVLFHLKARVISSFEVITDVQEIMTYHAKFNLIKDLATSCYG